MDCKFSHYSYSSRGSGKVEVYTCANDVARSLVTNDRGDPQGHSVWVHHTEIKGKYYTGTPNRVQSADGETLMVSAVHSSSGLPAMMNSRNFEGSFPWQELVVEEGRPSSEFQATIEHFAQKIVSKSDAIMKDSTDSSELMFEDATGELLQCKRFKAKPGRTCFLYQCPNETIASFSPQDSMNGPVAFSLKLENGTAAARKMSSLRFPESGQISISDKTEDYDDNEFYDLMTSPLSSYKWQMNDCDDPGLSKFHLQAEKALLALKQKWEETDYKVLVKSVDGVLKTVASAGPVPENFCRYEDVYYDKGSVDLGDVQSLLRKQSKNKVYSPKEAQEVFKFFQAQKDIPWGYSNEGCYARAHMAAFRTEEELNVDMDKVWLYGHDLAPKSGAGIKWTYHVAPSMNVRGEDGKVVTMVLDPSLSDGPLRVEEWSALFSPSKNPPLRGSVSSLELTPKTRPTYTVTGNEIFNPAELTLGIKLTAQQKMDRCREDLKKFSDLLEARKKQ